MSGSDGILYELMTYTQAKEKKCALQHYINLIDNYDENISQEAWIIKNFAMTNSISKVINLSNNKDFPFNVCLTRDYIKEVLLNENNHDELQILLRRAYKKRYKIKAVK